MPDPGKTGREYMPDEKAKEIFTPECSGFAGIVITIIFPRESYFCFVYVQYTVVRDSRSVCVSAKIINDLFGPAKRLFGITTQPLSKSVAGTLPSILFSFFNTRSCSTNRARNTLLSCFTLKRYFPRLRECFLQAGQAL